MPPPKDLSSSLQVIASSCLWPAWRSETSHRVVLAGGVDFADLSWEQRERVLRALFVRMNAANRRVKAAGTDDADAHAALAAHAGT